MLSRVITCHKASFSHHAGTKNHGPLLFLGKLGATSVVIAILGAAALLLGAPQDMAGLGVP